MTPRRIETRIPTHQPVRFYKLVALSFLAITLVLLGVIVFLSSKRATITIVTKESPADASLVVSATDLGGLVTTSTIVVSDTFFPDGDTEVPGVAIGTMTIVNNSATAQPLVATTRFLSADDVLFRLRDRVTVPANGQVTAEVYADEEGEGGNVAPGRFTIPGLSETRQQQVYGELTEPTTGGVRSVGMLTQADLDTAEKTLLEQIIAQSEAATPSLGEGRGIVRLIANSTVESSDEVGEELTEFSVTVRAELVQALYDESAVLARAEEAIERQIVDDTEIIETVSEAPEVSFQSYEDGEALLQVFYSGLAKLNPESPQLNKIMFFGKTRDEVRRYVLALDHVHSVDIEFQPAWMQTVPHVNEHVNVIIKNVR